MADLLDCGVNMVDFRADAHECRLLVSVGAASALPDHLRSSLKRNQLPAIALILVCLLMVFACAKLGYLDNGQHANPEL